MFAAELFGGDDLWPASLLDDLGGNGCAGNRWLTKGDAVAADDQHLAKLDDLARVAPDLVDLDQVLGSHAVLLTAGSDDCEHRFWSSCLMRPDRLLPVG